MSLCEKCRSCGLPIYPVRYAVSPAQMLTHLPKWAEKKELLSLNKDSKYVLRTTRKGYLYLFCQYEDNAIDLDVSVYKVDENGGFWQIDISKELDLLRFGDDIKSANNEQQTIPLGDVETSCSNSAHEASNIAFIVLTQPDKCDKAWLAYSEHKWSLDTLRKYLNEEDKRDIRMQVIRPKEWIQKQESANGITPVTKEAIASTIESQYIDYLLQPSDTSNQFYGKNPETFPYLYNHRDNNSPISTSPIAAITESSVFEYDKSLFKRRTTLTPWLNLSYYSKESSQLTEGYSAFIYRKIQSKQRNNTKAPAMMVALMDSIGIVAELSNWGNSALAAFKKVITERQWENSTCSSIEFFEQFIKNDDLNNNQQNFKKHIRQQNKEYLSDVEYYRKPIDPPSASGLPSSTRRIPGWSTAEKAKGERVIKIVNQAKNYIPYNPNFPYHYYVSDLEIHLDLCKSKAKELVDFTEQNYLLKELGEDRYASILEDIFALSDRSETSKIEKLNNQCNLIRNELEVKAKDYEVNWHKQNGTEASAEKRWRKYKNRLLHSDVGLFAYDNYRKKYNQFLQESGSYVERLIEDLIKWIDCFKQKEKHPLSLAADDFAQDSDDYLAFANDILMTLGTHVDNDRVVKLFTQFITDQTLDAHNIVWSAVFAKRKLTKEQQQKYINLMHGLDKTTPMQREDYGQLLDKLSTVLSFSEEAEGSEESKIFEAWVDTLINFDFSILDEENKSNSIDLIKELASLFESQRNFLLDGNSTDAQITAMYIQPIKANILATSVVFLKYLQLQGGKISSAFAEAFFIATNPSPQLSKSALERKMQAYYDWSNRLKKSVANNFNTAGTKLSIAYQNINQKMNGILSTTTAGKGLIGFMAFYQLKTLYEIISDDRYKTQAQQFEANYKLIMAATGIISLSFKFAIVHGENNQLNDKTLKNFGFFGNIFGFISGVTQIAISWNEDTSNKTKAEKAFYWMGFISAIVSTVDIFLQLGKRSLLQITDTCLKLITQAVAKKAILGGLVFIAGRGVMLLFILALNPWINLGLFICQAIYELNKPDEIEEWLERCRFGEFQGGLHEKRSSRYESQQQEVEAFKAILMKYEKEWEKAQQERQQIEMQKNQPVITSGDWQNILTYPVVP